MKKNIAIIGVPNSGKSSILNQLCKNKYFDVANWSGFTTTKDKTKINYNGNVFTVNDLPGIYTLKGHSKDEILAIKEIIYGKYDLYIQVIDSTDLETGLYLSLLLKELGIPLMIFLNFSDKAQKFKTIINEEKLSKVLKIPVLKTCAKNRKFVGKALKKIENYFLINNKSNNYYYYNNDLNSTFYLIKNQIIANCASLANKSQIEKNYFILHDYREKYPVMNIDCNNLKAKIYKQNLMESSLILKRQNYINNIIKSSVVNYSIASNKRLYFTFKVDKYLLNKWLSIPLFLSLMLLLFILIFNFGTPYKDFFSDIFTGYIPTLLKLNTNTWYGNFINNGLLNGVGTLLSFVPIMYLLFIIISFIQQSGILARVAFSMKKVLNIFGLSGKSIVPFILGFGCNVASVYSTRIIQNDKERKATALLSPFMSCSARIVVFGLFASAFFGSNGALVIFSLYLLGIITAFILALIVKWITKYKKNDFSGDIIELTPYEIPRLSSLIKGANNSIKGYSQKAVTVILLFTIGVWFLSYFPHHGDIESSFLSNIKYVFQPIFKPLGFGNSWILTVSIIPGIIAKETIVASLALLSGVSTQNSVLPNFWVDLKNTFENSFIYLLPNHWFNNEVFDLNPAGNLGVFLKKNILTFSAYPQIVAYSYLIFILLTIPCITTIAALKQEFGWKLTLQSITIGLFVPYFTSLLFFQLLTIILKI